MKIEKDDLVMAVHSDVAESLGKIGTAAVFLGPVYFPDHGLFPSWHVRFPTPIRTINDDFGTDFAIPEFALIPIAGARHSDVNTVDQPLEVPA
ncbi:MAG: hypothetical protein A3I66_01285 [Burkholderiales bacterium RIFCSPLOWO2_02_FULL_57_36]|nr:MAG: hypothetical protein A3I66_01285 [Burkholderiales bacterium RIFCSPLOWO2_02_FULL_57_36]